MPPTRVLAAGLLCAGALATSAVVAPAANASTGHPGSGDSDRGGVTTVVLDPALVPVLADTLEVRPVAPGTLTTRHGVTQASFPISEVEGKVIEHRGGLRFTPVGGGTLKITRFAVDLRTGFLSARASLDGTRLGEVDVFALGPVRPIAGKTPSCSGTPAGLTLTPQAARALGAPSFGGAFVGDACVVPGSAEDDD
jgi:hypothetical protein